MSDVLGKAIHDFYQGNKKHKLWIDNKYGNPEEMPVETYFRTEDDMPDLEWLAMEQCRGKVLDIGAGAGSHSLLLQANGFDVTALDISPLAVQTMKLRGVKKALSGDVAEFNEDKFDTLLLLMNGIGLAGTLHNLTTVLLHMKSLLKSHGQILFDSSDVSYLYNGNLPADRYHGEIDYLYTYAGQSSDWFKWLYVDETTMLQAAAQCGYIMDVLIEDDFGQYLARLTAL